MFQFNVKRISFGCTFNPYIHDRTFWKEKCARTKSCAQRIFLNPESLRPSLEFAASTQLSSTTQNEKLRNLLFMANYEKFGTYDEVEENKRHPKMT